MYKFLIGEVIYTSDNWLEHPSYESHHIIYTALFVTKAIWFVDCLH